MQRSALYTLQKRVPKHFQMQHLGHQWGAVSLHIYPKTSSVHRQQWLKTLEKALQRSQRRLRWFHASAQHIWASFVDHDPHNAQERLSFGKIEQQRYSGYWQSHRMHHIKQAKRCAQFCMEQIKNPALILTPTESYTCEHAYLTQLHMSFLTMYSSLHNATLSVQQTAPASYGLKKAIRRFEMTSTIEPPTPPFKGHFLHDPDFSPSFDYVLHLNDIGDAKAKTTLDIVLRCHKQPQPKLWDHMVQFFVAQGF